jgi:hypothetical protein
VKRWTSSFRSDTREPTQRRQRPGARAKREPLLCWLLVALVLVASPSCSLVYTRGPHPEIHPSPECTTSPAAPVADTGLAVLSLTLLGLGAASVGWVCPGCGALDLFGIGAIVLGTVFAAVFTTSAVVGYQRTGACRALKASEVPPAPLTASSSLLGPATPSEACPTSGDAPRRCPARAE